VANFMTVPTTADVNLLVEEKVVALVQSYRATATRKGKAILAFGQNEPVATIDGAEEYVLELSRLYATEEAAKSGVDFMSLSDFSLTVDMPGRHIVYSGCRWTKVEESADVGGTVLENVVLTAAKRTVQRR